MGSNWQVTSSTCKNGAVAVGGILVGALFLWLTRNGAASDETMAAARWLGVVLAAIGASGLLFMEELVTTVDKATRRLVLDRKTRWGRSRTVIPFSHIDSIRVVKVGSSSDGTPSYWLQVLLKSGRSCATGVWSLDEAHVGCLAEQLAADVGCGCCPGAERHPASAPSTVFQVAVAALGALAAYVLWYRLSVGPWCSAMWVGTAPPLLMLVAFALLLAVLRRLWS
ncbi:MAG TPA: hypothetical protein VMK12_02835 [Anaeromyxobacteraceae bacterium]|nr:hypothetical protein [Anaeromyxobacteraceae bacterium]